MSFLLISDGGDALLISDGGDELLRYLGFVNVTLR